MTTVEVSRPDKVLFPDAGVTKADLAAYYERVAEWMLPHLEGRPLNLQRFPDGVHRQGFLSQQIPDHFPDWVDRVTVPKEDGSVTHAMASDADTLVYLADQAVITPHAWLSRADDIGRPDRLVFDLDPSIEDFAAVRTAALTIARLLRGLELTPYAMSTGSRGIHVVIPLERRQGFDEVRGFARRVADVAARSEPDLLTTEQRKAKRGDRILIDVMRNGFAQTAVPPYAVRAKPDAPVAAPLSWDELSSGRFHPRRFTVRNVFRRLARKTDPWADMRDRAQALAAASERL
jgi:bifunctional non-homologous end joining protein LigD